MSTVQVLRVHLSVTFLYKCKAFWVLFRKGQTHRQSLVWVTACFVATMRNYIIPFLPSVTINGSLIFLNLIINICYGFCLIFPSHTGKRKQPLTVLLEFLILCILFYCVIVISLGIYAVSPNEKKYYIQTIFYLIIDVTTDFSMVSFVWLNFYYYIQIVPARCSLFHWVKRNIKSTIYVILVVDVLVTMFWKTTVDVQFIISAVGNHHWNNCDSWDWSECV